MPDLAQEAQSSTSSLPSVLAQSPIPPCLLTQGAEALLYRTTFLNSSTLAALKYRPPKPYRHPALDARLTRHRILAEARILVKLRREGVAVPAVYAIDWECGWVLMEWIDGGTVRAYLDLWLDRLKESAQDDAHQLQIGREKLLGLMGRVGRAVGRMHAIGVVHGDLTTSNLMVRKTAALNGIDRDGLQSEAIAMDVDAVVHDQDLQGDVVLIDFGLAAQSVQDEDRAVDLYVLERAFGSTHPKTEDLFQELLKAYGTSYKGARVTLKKLEEVRMRGRKKIMIG